MQVLAEVLGAEAALARIQFVSGTHAIATALYSVLRPGDELLAVAGRCDLQCCTTLCMLCCYYTFLEMLLSSAKLSTTCVYTVLQLQTAFCTCSYVLCLRSEGKSGQPDQLPH